MPDLCYGRSIYGEESVQDLNPLLPQRYQKLLVICARDGQETRLREMYGAYGNIYPVGWWRFAEDEQFFRVLQEPWDAICVLNPERWHEYGHKFLDYIQAKYGPATTADLTA